MHVSIQLTTSTHCGPRQKPSSENHPWGGITEWASARTARLSRLWKGRIYWIPERAFSPSPALSATCLETGLHYRWASGSHHTLTALRLPPVDAHRCSTCICKNMEAASMWMHVTLTSLVWVLLRCLSSASLFQHLFCSSSVPEKAKCQFKNPWFKKKKNMFGSEIQAGCRSFVAFQQQS